MLCCAQNGVVFQYLFAYLTLIIVVAGARKCVIQKLDLLRGQTPAGCAAILDHAICIVGFRYRNDAGP